MERQEQSKFKPRLAISVYHNVDDLIAIPKQIHSIEPRYELFLGPPYDTYRRNRRLCHCQIRAITK